MPCLSIRDGGLLQLPASCPACLFDRCGKLPVLVLALELAPEGILVNSIAPGFFPTKMSNGLLDMAGGADVLADATPNKRLGHPEDVAAAVVYLCGRSGGHLNGATIVLDGGSVLQAKL